MAIAADLELLSLQCARVFCGGLAINSTPSYYKPKIKPERPRSQPIGANVN